MTDNELNDRFSGVAELIRDVANRIDQRFDAIEQRIDSLVSRLDRVETNLGAVILQTTGFNKSLADHDRLIQGALATQSAQLRAFDALSRELREHKHGNGSSPAQSR
jgi:hypothetical protein